MYDLFIYLFFVSQLIFLLFLCFFLISVLLGRFCAVVSAPTGCAEETSIEAATAFRPTYEQVGAVITVLQCQGEVFVEQGGGGGWYSTRTEHWSWLSR